MTTAAQARRGFTGWIYSVDFNERCPNVEYVLEFEHQLKGKAPTAFDRVQYIEQPTARDLAANRKNTMFEAAKLRPVVIDESLTGLDALLLAREMGYTGAALKACKGQSQTLLLAAAMQKYKMFRCVQDLTCPGAALVHSVGIAAHIPGTAAVEANAREYVPSASAGWLTPRVTKPRASRSTFRRPPFSATKETCRFRFSRSPSVRRSSP